MMSKQQNKPMVGNLEYFKNGKKNRPTNISAIAAQPWSVIKSVCLMMICVHVGSWVQDVYTHAFQWIVSIVDSEQQVALEDTSFMYWRVFFT